MPLTSQQEMGTVLENKVVQFEYIYISFDHQTLNSKTELTKKQAIRVQGILAFLFYTPPMCANTCVQQSKRCLLINPGQYNYYRSQIWVLTRLFLVEIDFLIESYNVLLPSD